jgi:hypothetical protein
MGIPEPLEKDVKRVCADWLTLWGAVPIRVNSGAMKIGGRYVKFNDKPGCSDSLVCLPGGRFLALEVKRLGADKTAAKRKAEQRAFLDEIVKAGGLGLIVRSLDQLKAALKAEGYDVNKQGGEPT